MTNLEFLLRKRENLNNQLNGILAGMCDDDENEVAQKIRRITFVIDKIKRQRREKNKWQ
tara:strand:- start:89 stop:265 length:177 start_codon:yes stop_codon:yes gene_type:complete